MEDNYPNRPIFNENRDAKGRKYYNGYANLVTNAVVSFGNNIQFSGKPKLVIREGDSVFGDELLFQFFILEKAKDYTRNTEHNTIEFYLPKEFGLKFCQDMLDYYWKVKGGQKVKDIEQIKEEVKFALLSVKRKGMQEFVKFLLTTDYFTAPASANHHLSKPSGLLEHHYNIYNALIEKNKMFKLGLKEETIILTSLLHDVCKCGLYMEVSNGYEINKNIQSKGHAKLSLNRIKKFIALTDEEEAMIKYHMGTFGVDNVGYLNEYTTQEIHDAIKRFPSVQIFASTDMEVTQMEGLEKEEPTIKLTVEEISKIIDKLDAGEGVSVEDVISKFKEQEKCEAMLEKMKQQGDIFENRRGFIKKL